MAKAQDKTQTDADQQFGIQRLYVRDLSFEAPGVPKVFQGEWKPELNLDINTKTNVVEDELHEVILGLTVTVKNNNETAFLVEVQQAGIFSIKGFNEQQLQQTLGAFCPSVLYPYAREVVSDVVIRGGFPQLILAPINFDALYAQHLQQQDDGGEAGSKTTAEAEAS